MATPTVKTEELHQRITNIFIDRHEFANILTREALRLANIDGKNGVTIKLNVKPATEGSPAYNVGHEATIEIKENIIGEPE